MSNAIDLAFFGTGTLSVVIFCNLVVTYFFLIFILLNHCGFAYLWGSGLGGAGCLPGERVGASYHFSCVRLIYL